MKTIIIFIPFILCIFLLVCSSGSQTWSEETKTSSGDEIAISSDSEALFPVKQDGKWGYIDITGKIIISPQFDFAQEFHEGLAAVQVGEYPKWKVGYIDKKGNFVIQPQFFTVGDFSEGFARVTSIGGGSSYIDKTGKMLTFPQDDGTWWTGYFLESANDFSEGLAAVKLKGLWGYIDTEGRLVIKNHFASAREFRDGLAWVSIKHNKKSKWGCIDKNGKYVIEPRFEDATIFSEGLAAVKIDGKYGYLDETGNLIIEPRFEYAGNFSEGLTRVRADKKWGYINEIGEVKITMQFQSAGEFHNGLTWVVIDGQFGFINKNGEIVIKPQYDWISPFMDSFQDGLACVGFGSLQDIKWGYIDHTGKYIWEPTN